MDLNLSEHIYLQAEEAKYINIFC